jgi:tRNA threonylcarbamoyladenosine biosynthesis protein TsaE
MTENVVCSTPEETFALGIRIGESLEGGELILLTGGLGAGKTLFTKGILDALDFDIDDVTSPSFALVNLYHAKFDVYHIDLWRLDNESDVAMAVGLDEILEDDKVVVVIEWSERLNRTNFRSKVIKIDIAGEGDDPRQIMIES